MRTQISSTARKWQARRFNCSGSIGTPATEPSVQIELTDGTSFTCCVSVRPAVEASLYRGGVGTPETIRDYEF